MIPSCIFRPFAASNKSQITSSVKGWEAECLFLYCHEQWSLYCLQLSSIYICIEDKWPKEKKNKTGWAVCCCQCALHRSPYRPDTLPMRTILHSISPPPGLVYVSSLGEDVAGQTGWWVCLACCAVSEVKCMVTLTHEERRWCFIAIQASAGRFH